MTHERRNSDLWKSRQIITSIIQVLEEIIVENATDAELLPVIQKQTRLPFCVRKVPKISKYCYIERILKYSRIEESTLILSLIYIDKVCEVNNLLLTEFNIHRIIFTSLLVSIKYNEDEYYSNSFYAKVAGLSLREVNMLENEFLKMMDFKLFVNDETFVKYRDYLKKYRIKGVVN